MFASVSLAGMLICGPALALKPKKNEAERLKACEIDICSLVVEKKPRNGWLTCNVNKTWVKKDIKKGAGKKKMSWSSGDAQCSLKVRLERGEVIGALTKSEYEVRFRRHYVNCLVEDGKKVDKVKVSLAPKMKFKDGKVKKIWLNIKEVDAPPGITTLVWTAANLEDGLGIFHGEMLKEVNKFLHKKCSKRLKEQRRKERRAKRKEAKAAAEAAQEAAD